MATDTATAEKTSMPMVATVPKGIHIDNLPNTVNTLSHMIAVSTNMSGNVNVGNSFINLTKSDLKAFKMASIIIFYPFVLSILVLLHAS